MPGDSLPLRAGPRRPPAAPACARAPLPPAPVRDRPPNALPLPGDEAIRASFRNRCWSGPWRSPGLDFAGPALAVVRVRSEMSTITRVSFGKIEGVPEDLVKTPLNKTGEVGKVRGLNRGGRCAWPCGRAPLEPGPTLGEAHIDRAEVVGPSVGAESGAEPLRFPCCPRALPPPGHRQRPRPATRGTSGGRKRRNPPGIAEHAGERAPGLLQAAHERL